METRPHVNKKNTPDNGTNEIDHILTATKPLRYLQDKIQNNNKNYIPREKLNIWNIEFEDNLAEDIWLKTF